MFYFAKKIRISHGDIKIVDSSFVMKIERR